MKHLLLLLPLAACAPYVDPCLRPIVENPLCVETDGADNRSLAADPVPDHPNGGDSNGGGSSDDHGDVSDDSNGDGSDD